MCGREIKGRDYIHLTTAKKKDIYFHSAPCEWYADGGNMDDDTAL